MQAPQPESEAVPAALWRSRGGLIAGEACESESITGRLFKFETLPSLLKGAMAPLLNIVDASLFDS
jgi:hypothetical protein